VQNNCKDLIIFCCADTFCNADSVNGENRHNMPHKSILVIEDDPAICQTVKDLLEIEGYDVNIASNGRVAAEMLSTLDQMPCVILLDLMMPVMNGWQFLDVQRNDPKLKDIPVVICSAYEESARSVNPNGFIPKPLKLGSLLSAVQKFCA
jgi:CheY-like chemotaxis protein